MPGILFQGLNLPRFVLVFHAPGFESLFES